MRPLVLLLALFALLLPACQSGPGPSSALEVQPAVGAGARVFAGPEDGVGAAARLDLGKYGFRTGKQAGTTAARVLARRRRNPCNDRWLRLTSRAGATRAQAVESRRGCSRGTDPDSLRRS
jgi:hypothetical protein